MAEIILVHGLFVGSWCWERVTPFIEAAGHVTRLVELPQSVGEGTSEGTFERYVGAIIDAIDASEQPVLLVLHSASGVFGSQAVELRSGAVAAIAYVAAIIPSDGESVSHWAARVPDSLSVRSMVADEHRGTLCMRPESIRDALYADCLEADAAHAQQLMVETPLAPLAMPVHLTSERFGRVPRYYVQCTADRAIPISTQREFCRRVHCVDTFTLPTGHSPFYAKPHDFADCLLAIAQRVSN